MAGPSAGPALSHPAVTRKRGLGRFSLRRIFGSTAFGRRSMGRHCTVPLDVDSCSHNNSINLASGPEHKDSSGLKDAIRLTAGAHSSSDSELNSLSSGRNDAHFDCPSGHLASAQNIVECPVCLLILPAQCFPELSSCNYHSCYDCLHQYLQIEISEGRVNISCPKCIEPLHPNDIRMVLNDENIMIKYESFLLRRILVTDPDARWCPAPDCGYAVIASGCASCPKLKCERPGCDTYFCYHCKQEWHPNQTCDAARAQRARHSSNPRSASVSFSQDSIIQRDDIKPCPCCKVLIVKMDDGSCNHMTCSVCGTEFCWLCMKEISDLHYLSPSGCTFWGKKPWSRKKKILWQLGMLVGAPVGIALIAGIAVPAIIIGIPVWVGRKLHAKYERQQSSRHKRNLVVTSGVIASILVSPVLAGIAVGIGVPILLAYVYGVVPISLCRSGGCGVTTSASGVRIEFDEENDIGIGSSVAADGVSVDTAASHRGVNPSIGEVSLGMSTSLSLGSGSHMGMMRDRDSDRESASNTALAGSIASASLAGNIAHKLEVQADVSSNKRFSLSSHSETASATVSLSERSANMSLADDASTRALAGSLLGYRDATTTAVTPVEVHVDAQFNPDEKANCAKDGQNTNEEKNFDADDNEMMDDALGSFLLHPKKSSCKFHKCEVTPSSTQEFEVSPTNHIHDPRECYVSFIDESPSSGERDKTEDVTCKFSIRKDNMYGIRPKSLKPEKILSFNNAEESMVSEVENIPVKLCNITGRVTKSLDQLSVYCNCCQKTHRPCCLHKHLHNVTSNSVQTPEHDYSSKYCLPGSSSEPIALLGGAFYSVSKQNNQANSNEGTSKNEDEVLYARPVIESVPDTTTVCLELESEKSSVCMVRNLPHVQEPEFEVCIHPRYRTYLDPTLRISNWIDNKTEIEECSQKIRRE